MSIRLINPTTDPTYINERLEIMARAIRRLRLRIGANYTVIDSLTRSRFEAMEADFMDLYNRRPDGPLRSLIPIEDWSSYLNRIARTFNSLEDRVNTAITASTGELSPPEVEPEPTLAPLPPPPSPAPASAPSSGTLDTDAAIERMLTTIQPSVSAMLRAAGSAVPTPGGPPQTSPGTAPSSDVALAQEPTLPGGETLPGLLTSGQQRGFQRSDKTMTYLIAGAVGLGLLGLGYWFWSKRA